MRRGTKKRRRGKKVGVGVIVRTGRRRKRSIEEAGAEVGLMRRREEKSNQFRLERCMMEWLQMCMIMGVLLKFLIAERRKKDWYILVKLRTRGLIMLLIMFKKI
jgi:hypothetical protein